MALNYVGLIRGFGRNARLAFVSAALLWFSVFGLYAVLFNLYLLRLDFDPQFIGIANAGGLLSGSLTSLLSGEIGRRKGTRRAMIAGLLMAVVGYALVPAAELLPAIARGLWLLVTYFLGCLGAWSLYMVNVTPFLVSATAPEQRSHAFSLLSAVPAAAAFVGSLAGGAAPGAFASFMGLTTESPTPYGISLFIAALLIIPAMLSIAVAEDRRDVAEEEAQEGSSAAANGRSAAPIAMMLAVGAFLFLRAAGQGATRVFINVYMDEGLGVSTSLIGSVSALGQLVGIPAALVAPALATRFGNVRTYSLGIMGMAISALPIALIPRWEAAAVGYVGSIALFSMATPALVVFEQLLVPPAWRPAMEGAVMMSVNLGRALMALSGGYIIASAGYCPLFLVSAALMAVGSVCFYLYFRVPRGEYARE